MSEASALGRFYGVTLARIEKGICLVLLALVILLSTAEIVARNLEWAFFDRVGAQVQSYYLAFHLGFFGAVLACRDVRHIAIDALTPHLSEAVRQRTQAVLLFVSAVTCAALAVVAWGYVADHVGPDEAIVPGKVGLLWNDRLWKAPTVLALAWMALHFFVNAALAAKGRLAHHLPAGTDELALEGSSEPPA